MLWRSRAPRRSASDDSAPSRPDARGRIARCARSDAIAHRSASAPGTRERSGLRRRACGSGMAHRRRHGRRAGAAPRREAPMMIELDQELRLTIERIALSLEALADSAEKIAAALGPPKKAPPKP